MNLDMPHQFVLSRDDYPWKEGWHRRDCGHFVLQFDPRLPVQTIVDQDENRIGFALGWLVDQPGALVVEKIHAPFRRTDCRPGDVENFIYGFGGRYIFIILGEQFRRVYLDVGATLGVVYSGVENRAGSTVSLLALGKTDHPVWSDLTGVFPDDRPNQFYPAGLTLDPDIQRLLPNHYLDLDSWQSVRHWPSNPIDWVAKDQIQDGVKEIVDLACRHIHAAVRSAPHVYMPLTAGRDSRMLLACSKEVCDEIDYVTFDYSALGRPPSYLMDLRTAAKLAEACGLRHKVIPVPREPPPGTAINYLRRIGYSGGSGKSGDFYWSCEQHLDMSAAWLTGFAGEVGRAFYWRDGDEKLLKLGPEALLSRMGLPVSVEFVNATDRWLSGLSIHQISTVLDLAYIEHRVGCWASPHLYGAAPFLMNYLPLCHRRIFDLMIRFPPAYRQKQYLARDVIAQAWPDLPALPFNSFTGFRKLWNRAQWYKKVAIRKLKNTFR